MHTKISRSELDNTLENIGIIKNIKYEVTGEYDIQNGYIGSIAIELKEKPFYTTIQSLSNCLLSLSNKWLLFPRFTYLGAEKNNEKLSIPISPSESDGIEWSAKDQELIDTIVAFHATSGGHIGWDLYMCDIEGKYLILLSHHEYFLIQSTKKKFLEHMALSLGKKHVTYENNI